MDKCILKNYVLKTNFSVTNDALFNVNVPGNRNNELREKYFPCLLLADVLTQQQGLQSFCACITGQIKCAGRGKVSSFT